MPASRPIAPEDWSPDLVDPVVAVATETDGIAPLDEAALLELRHHGLSRARLWAEPGGFALLRRGELDLVVAPDARGHGLGTRLLTAAGDEVLRGWSHGDHPAAARLAARFGFSRTRELWVMRRPLKDLPPVPSADVTLRGWRPTDEQPLLVVNAAAFADHPEQGAMDSANLAERMAEPWFRAEDLLLAEDADGRLLGFHWTKRHDDTTGEVYVVGVAPEAAGRGLGRHLTLAGLHHLAEAGLSRVLLYVDAGNARAVRLYEGLGFTHAPTDTHVQYARG